MRALRYALWALVLGVIALACSHEFYESPRHIDEYPERHAVRGLEDLHREAWPIPPELEELSTYRQCEQLVDSLAGLEISDRDGLREKVRQTRELNRYDYHASLANWLIEYDEWLQQAEVESDREEAQQYFDWRLKNVHRTGKQILYPTSVLQLRPGGLDRRRMFLHERVRDNALKSLLFSMLEEVPETSVALSPFLTTQRATAMFYHGRFQAAEAIYRQVIARWPDHPRAEAAKMMLARSEYITATEIKIRRVIQEARERQQWHVDKSQFVEILAPAKKAYESYLRDYPEGRFRATAYGWLGGIDVASGDDLSALKMYFKQLDEQSTAEIGLSVMRECDRCLVRLIEGEKIDEVVSLLPYDKLAQYPPIAMQLIYELLDPVARERLQAREDDLSQYKWSDSSLEFLKERLGIRRDGRELVKRLAQAFARVEKSRWPKMLRSVLVRASLNQGDFTTAESLSRVGPSEKYTPDLYYARAMALHRLGKNAEVVEFLKKLEEQESEELKIELRYLRAKCLQLTNKSGEAAYAHLVYAQDFESMWSDESALRARTILQFAPLESIIPVLRDKGRHPAVLQKMRFFVRTRLLAKENFRGAKRWLDKPLEGEDSSSLLLTKENWLQNIEPLAMTFEEELPADPDQRALLYLKRAKMYKKLRSRLTMVLYSDELAALRNAKTLGYEREDALGFLDSLDEIHLARKWFLEAAKVAVDSNLKATALEEANDALLKFAECRRYGALRAAELDFSSLSQSLVKRLQNECAGSLQERRAIAYQFDDDPLEGEWMPGDYAPWNAEFAFVSEWKKPTDVDAFAQNLWLAPQLEQQLKVLVADEDESLDEKKKELAKLVGMIRSQSGNNTLARLLNNAEDILLFSNQEGVTSGLLSSYAKVRLSQKVETNIDPVLDKYPDFLSFARLRLAPHKLRIRACQSFLKSYPDSPKREAALVRLIRAQIRDQIGTAKVIVDRWPSAPYPGGYKSVVIEKMKDLDPQSISESLAMYRRDFPKGRYVADVDLLEAQYAAVNDDFSLALKKVISLMESDKNPSLSLDLGLLFGAIMMKMQDQESRLSLLDAIKDNPTAVVYLKRLAEGDTCLWRLKPYISHLEAMLLLKK